MWQRGAFAGAVQGRHAARWGMVVWQSPCAPYSTGSTGAGKGSKGPSQGNQKTPAWQKENGQEANKKPNVGAEIFNAFRKFKSDKGIASPATTSTTPSPSAPPPTMPAAPPKMKTGIEGTDFAVVRKVLEEAELGRCEEDLYNCGVTNLHAFQTINNETLASAAGLTEDEIARLRARLDIGGWWGVLEEAGLANFQTKFHQIGLSSVNDLRRPAVLKELTNVLKPVEIQRLLLTPVWYPQVQVSRKGSKLSSDTATLALPRQGAELLAFWLETVGMQSAGGGASLEEALGRVYFRLNPEALPEQWGVEFHKQKSYGAKRELMKELVGRLLPEMRDYLPEYLDKFPDVPLVNILKGMTDPSPLPFHSVLTFKTKTAGEQPSTKKKRSAKGRQAWKHLPPDLLMAFERLYPEFQSIIDAERKEAARPPQTRKERKYYAKMSALLQAAIDDKSTKKEEVKALSKAARTLDQKFALPRDQVPEQIREQMAAWEQQYVQEKKDAMKLQGHNAHMARVLGGIPDQSMYSCTEVRMGGDFYSQEFFSRMKVWWTLNKFYGIGFPDFHETLGKGKPMQPQYKQRPVMDNVDRTL